jgi:glycosyltransferase involved in cell wall biosynthesis
MEKAAIAFDNSGGAPELLNNGAGFIEPYLDVHSVAKTISVLYHNREMMKETGKKAREKVEKEFSSNVIPAKVLECLRNI